MMPIAILLQKVMPEERNITFFMGLYAAIVLESKISTLNMSRYHCLAQFYKTLGSNPITTADYISQQLTGNIL
uniref:Uncharacterized protein n=1 Tax=Arundo donax TaxID=35708 RepID=A0A0A9GWA4_ARUDO